MGWDSPTGCKPRGRVRFRLITRTATYDLLNMSKFRLKRSAYVSSPCRKMSVHPLVDYLTFFLHWNRNQNWNVLEESNSRLSHFTLSWPLSWSSHFYAFLAFVLIVALLRFLGLCPDHRTFTLSWPCSDRHRSRWPPVPGRSQTLEVRTRGRCWECWGRSRSWGWLKELGRVWARGTREWRAACWPRLRAGPCRTLRRLCSSLEPGIMTKNVNLN